MGAAVGVAATTVAVVVAVIVVAAVAAVAADVTAAGCWPPCSWAAGRSGGMRGDRLRPVPSSPAPVQQIDRV